MWQDFGELNSPFEKVWETLVNWAYMNPYKCGEVRKRFECGIMGDATIEADGHLDVASSGMSRLNISTSA